MSCFRHSNTNALEDRGYLQIEADQLGKKYMKLVCSFPVLLGPKTSRYLYEGTADQVLPVSQSQSYPVADANPFGWGVVTPS